MPDSGRLAPTGLCMTCNNTGTCMYLLRTIRPVWRCEDFDDSGPDRNPRMQSPVVAPEPIPAQPGICSNCDNRVDCTLPRPFGGVWRCEEYA